MSVRIIRLLVLYASILTTASQTFAQRRAGAPAHAEWLDHSTPTELLNDQKPMKDIPSYVLDFAPLVHLSEEEVYWPSLMDEHLLHTTPLSNFTSVPESERHPTIRNLADFNKYDDGKFVYLQSEDDVQTDPAWLTSEHNIPVPPPASPEDEEAAAAQSVGTKKRGGKQKKVSKIGGRSPAPAFLIVIEKEEGVVDAFWFFFYSFNLGNTVFGIGFGDHVGDWEHTVVRFRDGVPEFMFVSEHAFGQTYTFDAMEKYGKRPVIYSGRGTHALYATPGIQAYILPFTILHDTTSHGPLWDPSLNLLSYHYTSPPDASDTTLNSLSPAEYPQNTLTPSLQSPDAATSWFYFGGCWGDKEYSSADARQYHAPLVGEKRFVDGPRGPRFKALGRPGVCPYGECKARTTIAPRLWVLDWLYNWAWTCGVFLGLVAMGLFGFAVGRHGVQRHGRWREGRRERRRWKGIEDEETSPLLSETASVASVEFEGVAGYGGYGTIGEVDGAGERGRA